MASSQVSRPTLLSCQYFMNNFQVSTSAPLLGCPKSWSWVSYFKTDTLHCISMFVKSHKKTTWPKSPPHLCHDLGSSASAPLDQSEVFLVVKEMAKHIMSFQRTCFHQCLPHKEEMSEKEEHLNVDDKIQLQTWVVSPCQHLEPPDKSFKEDQQKFQTS